MSEVLRVYHGSKAGLDGRIRPVSDGSCDFGRGFYMGSDAHQPETLICREKSPVLYTLDLELAGLKVLRMEPSEEWALFVAYNRGRLERYRDTPLYARFERMRTESDVIVGRIANDRMFTVMANFFSGLIGVPALVSSLTALNIGDQYCALTDKACGQIRIVDEKHYSANELENLRIKSENQRRRGAIEAERICQRMRREGESLPEILERLGAK